jgi:hypothetical protein
MPYETGKDGKGEFIRWGPKGKQYYYDPNSPSSMQEAYTMAHRQQEAVVLSQLRERGAII